MTMSMLLRAFFLSLAFSAAVATAGALDDFRAFTKDTRSASGDFTQVVVDRSGKVLRQSSGTFSIARPGKFRWTYVKPYAQVLVGDGEKVWVYDKDLNQVTIRPMDKALSATPAALLSGSSEFEKVFTVQDLAPADGLEWLGAKPKDPDSGLDSARLGFDKGTLARLEFVDNFGQTTTITISKLERNPSVPAETFKFTPPKGADVVGG